MKYNAVLLAGAENSDLIPEKLTTDYEALLEINGKAIVNYVLEALNNAEQVNRIIVVGPKNAEKLLIANGADLVIKSKKSIIENIEAGLEVLDKKFNINQPCLLITSDIPLVTSEAIDSFIADCERKGESGVYYPIISKEVVQSAYPTFDSTYVDLKDDTYTGGNLTLIKPKVIIESMPLLEKIIENRKNPFKMSRIIGLKFAAKLFFGCLSLAEIETKISQLIGSSCRAIISSYPELNLDVDKYQDLELMRNLIGN
ncbi:NTP transferase domain-containing protein [Sporohalobacter salinus]|uniref:NTP transferase domain-containing protein n=1 Tax=Sporohalobacter salinus TaxID=1494606 RepID=UPI001960ACC3|nr:NTP transferase domain-containing protein [Sporohalobacter salinus]MBM7623900.1 GTP:adenosylcobinamide-phosphate guanylyltransferase [Sporohalobacter salinus]